MILNGDNVIGRGFLGGLKKQTFHFSIIIVIFQILDTKWNKTTEGLKFSFNNNDNSAQCTLIIISSSMPSPLYATSIYSNYRLEAQVE